MERNDFFKEDCFGARNVLNGLTRHRFGQKADEIAGMSGLERDADFAVGLESADARAVTCARINHDERPPLWIYFDPLRRHDPREDIVHWPFELPAVHHEFHLVIEHVRSGLGQLFSIRVTALTHHIPEQDGSLCRVDHVIEGREERANTTSEFNLR